MSPKITNKISLIKTFNNFLRKKRPRKKRRHDLFTTFTVDFFSRSFVEKFEFFFSKIYHRVAKKSDRILQKKLLKNLF